MEPITEGGIKPLATLAEETEEIKLYPDNHEKIVQIGLELEASFWNHLIAPLREYSDIFLWTPTDMPKIDESVAIHKLSVNPNTKSVK